MTTPATRSLVPAYVLALFDEPPAGGEGAASSAGDGAGMNGDAGARGAAAGANTGAGRGSNGRFESIESANARIAELNAENTERRKENKELKAAHAATNAQISLANTRAIRGEARAELKGAGAIDDDIVDLLLRHAGDKIKIDEKTGEVVGVAEAIAAYRAAKPSFFRSASDDAAAAEAKAKADADKKAADDKAAADKKKADEEAAKGNRTGSGGSLGGSAAGEGDGTVNGLPNLRNLSPQERKDALRAYTQSIRGDRGRTR